MAKDKHENHRTSEVKPKGYKKFSRIFVAAFTAVILILGAGLYLHGKFQKPAKQSDTVAAVTSDIPGWWYQQYFGSSVCAKDICKPGSDPDQDKLTNDQEYFYHTNPLNPRTTKDKLNDGELVAAGFDPSKPGHVTFDTALTDDSMLGESLLFNSDIKQLINQSVNPSNLPLPLVQDSELKIVSQNSSQAVSDYLAATKKIMDKYFQSNAKQFVSDAMTSNSATRISDVKNRLVNAANDLKQVPVPADFVLLHKYTIALFQTLPQVVDTPTSDQLADESNPVGNAWFDQTQTAMMLYQKISLEQTRLQNKY